MPLKKLPTTERDEQEHAHLCSNPLLEKHVRNSAKQLIYDLTNNTQLILSYLEMNDVARALTAAKNSIRLLIRLTNTISLVYSGPDRREA